VRGCGLQRALQHATSEDEANSGGDSSVRDASERSQTVRQAGQAGGESKGAERERAVERATNERRRATWVASGRTGSRLTIFCAAPGAGSSLYFRALSGARDCDIVIAGGPAQRGGRLSEARAPTTRVQLGCSSVACAISRAPGDAALERRDRQRRCRRFAGGCGACAAVELAVK
jgi:hypothetical protein